MGVGGVESGLVGGGAGHRGDEPGDGVGVVRRHVCLIKKKKFK